MEIIYKIGYFFFYFFVGMSASLVAQTVFPFPWEKFNLLKRIILSLALVAVYFMFQYAYELLIELSK